MDHIKTAPSVLKEFLIYMQVIMGKSEKTVSEYFFDLRVFLRFLKLSKGKCSKDTPFEEISIGDVDLALLRSVQLSDLYDYMGYLYNDRGIKQAGRARKIAAVRSFFKYLANKTKALDQNPAKELDVPKIKKSLPRYLTLSESRHLLQSVQRADSEFKERDYAILTIFLNCGLRLSELAGINLNDIKDDFITVTGKGNKERNVYLNEACQAAISAYQKVRPVDGVKDRKAFFLSKRKIRISVKTVQWTVKKYIAQAGLDPQKYSAHKLRHTAATLLHKYGQVDIKTLQEILGHEHVSTTEIYTHVSSGDIKKAMEKNPLSLEVSAGEDGVKGRKG
jgi:integrase/recombinase XerD